MAVSESEPPEWFRAAVAAPVDDRTVVVDTVPITYRCWGPPGAPGVLLVHGGAAHARWWDHIAPLLASHRRIAAIDLSGHGDSGRRDRYTIETWAHEVLAVSEHADMSGRPVFVGHSMGGAVSLRGAALFGERLAGVVLVDSPIRNMSPEEHAAMNGRAFGPIRTYATKAQLVARFRTVPADQVTLPYITGRIANVSVRQVDGRWRWKFDPLIFAREPLALHRFAAVDCRLALLRAQRGLLSEDMSDALFDAMGRRWPVVEIVDAAHHVMLDQPLALVAALRAVLEEWQYSNPHAVTSRELP